MHVSGENNLIMDSIAVFDEIGEAGGNKDVNFVILMDGMHIEGNVPAQYKYLNNKMLSYPSVYLAQGENYAEAKPYKTFEDLDNLADKNNLTFILNYIKDKFPADNYGYIYKGHGGAGSGDIYNGSFISKIVIINPEEYKADGTIDVKKLEQRISKNPLMPEEWIMNETYLFDDNEKYPKAILAIYSKDSAEVLTYVDQNEVLQKVFGHKGLAFILLDCCWGMMLENVHIFSTSTCYFIASADECPALGIGYTSLCKFILERSRIKPDELAKMLVAVYYTIRYQDYDDPSDPAYKNMGVSLTCVDTTVVEDIIIPRLTKLCKEIIGDINDLTPILIAALNTCKDYTYSNPLVYKIFNIDLTWFLENIIFQISTSHKNFDLIHDLALELIRDINLYLITGYLGNNYKKTTPGKKAIGGKGITITLPKKEDYYNLSLVKPGSKIEFYSITNWRSMLLHFYANLSKREADTFSYLKNISTIRDLGNVSGGNYPKIESLSNNIILNYSSKSKNANWYEDFSDLNSIYATADVQLNNEFKNIIDNNSAEPKNLENIYILDIEPELKKITG